jgi:hypothetical protein
MNDLIEDVTAYAKREAARQERAATLRRQLCAAVDNHHMEQEALEWLLMRLGLSDEIDRLARSYVTFGEFTQRQWKFLHALMEGRSTAT